MQDLIETTKIMCKTKLTKEIVKIAENTNGNTIVDYIKSKIK